MFTHLFKNLGGGPDPEKIKAILEKQQQAVKAYLEHSDSRRFCTIKNGPCQALEFLTWRKDKNHLYVFANAAHCIEFFKMPKECIGDIRGKSDIDLINDFRERTGLQHSYGELCYSSDQDVERTLKPGHYIEVGYINHDLFILDTYKTPIIGADGKFDGSEGYAFNRGSRGVLFEGLINEGLKRKCLSVLTHEENAACYKVLETCKTLAFLSGFPTEE